MLMPNALPSFHESMITRLFLYRLSRCPADGPSFASKWVSGIVRSAGHGPSQPAVAIPIKKSAGDLAYNYLRGLGQPGGNKSSNPEKPSEAKEESRTHSLVYRV